METKAFQVREIACSHRGNYCATVDFKGIVRVWSLQNGFLVSTFSSCYSSGGRRIAISPDGSLCVTGSYGKEGIECHRVTDGSVLWRRRDLDLVQRLSFDLGHGGWVACFDEKACHLLERETGRTTAKLPRVGRVLSSPYDEVTMVEKGKGEPLELRRTRDARRIAHINRAAPAVLSVSFAPGRLLVAEMTAAVIRRTPDDQFVFTGRYEPVGGGPLRLFSIEDGREEWCYRPGEGTHFLNVSQGASRQRVYGVLREEGAEGVVLSLVSLRERERQILAESRQELRRATSAEFALGGDALVTSAGEVLDLSVDKPCVRLQLQNPES